jgi:hypothetical protein
MADRFPLIVNAVSKKIEEIASGDNLDLTGNGIVVNGDTGSGKYLSSDGTNVFWSTPGNVYLTATQTITNKTFQNCTISASANTISNIPNSSLQNKSITINNTVVELGGNVTLPNTDTTYDLSAVDGLTADTKIIRLTDSASNTDNVSIVAGANMSISRNGNDITLSSSFVDTDTVTTLQAATGGVAQFGAIKIAATGSSTVSQDTQTKTITINSVNTDTITRLRSGISNNFVSGDVTFLSGGATQIIQGVDGSNRPTLTISSTDTQTRVAGGLTATPVSGDVRIVGGSNTTVSQSGQTITVASTDTNTITKVAANSDILSAGDFRFTSSGATTLTASTVGGVTTIEISSTDTNTGGLITSSGGLVKVVNDIQIKNNANFTGNTVLKWDSGNNQLANSLIQDDGSTVTIGGDLLVTGTQTILNTTTLQVEDNIIELRRGPSLVGADGGIQVNRTTDATENVTTYQQLHWYESGGYWRSFDGSISHRFVTENETQVLTNKTLTAPTLSSPVLGVATATSINGLSIQSTASANLNIVATKTLDVQRSVSLTTDSASQSVSVNFRTGGNVVYRSDTLASLSATTSTQLRALITDTTGLDRLVFQNNPNILNGITTTSGSITLFNSAATTITAFGAATSISIGAVGGITTFNQNVVVNEDLTVGTGISDNITFNGTLNCENADIIIRGGKSNPMKIGRGGGSVSSNTRVGASALDNNISGARNTAFGYAALAAINTGSDNVAIGYNALPVGGISENNIAIGSESQLNNLNGAKNVSIGSNTLESSTTGDANVCIGHYAGFAATGSGNVLIGPSDDENSSNATYAPPNIGGDRQLVIASGTETWIRGDSTFKVTVPNDFQVNGDTIIQGSLLVNGTTTSINSNVMSIDDKNIELAAVVNATFQAVTQDNTPNISGITPTAGLIPGMQVVSTTGGISVPEGTIIESITNNTAVLSNSVTGSGTSTFIASGPSDLAANGGGIILKGSVDKTILYDHSRTDKYWTFSENIEIALGKKFVIGNQLALSATTLGSTVVNSSLTSVGTLTGLTVDGATTLGGRVVEKVFNSFTTTLTPSANVLTINVAGSNTILGTPATQAINEWAFTGVNLSNGQSITLTVILEANTAATYGDACSVDGTSIVNGIRWSGGSPPIATTNTDILTFIIVTDNSGVTRVFGQGNTDFS